MRLIKTLGCAMALAAVVATGARADEHDRLTYLTFSGPVQLPGITLTAGTYTFKLADIESNRHVVQVFSKDDMKLITTLMTIPNERLEPVKDTYIMFTERPAGSPQAMKAWFYPGRSIGEEFIYPKSQAVAIAKANRTEVLSSADEKSDATSTVGHVSDQGQFAQESVSTASTTSASATSSTTSASTTSASTTNDRRVDTEVVPNTASTTSASTTSASTTNDRHVDTEVVPNTASTTSASTTSGSTTSGTTTTGTTASTTTARSNNNVNSNANAAASPSVTATTASNNAPASTIPEAAAADTTTTRPSTTARTDINTPASTNIRVGTSGQANSAAPQDSQTAPPAARRLPRTASPLALFELLSGLSVAGGFGLRKLRNRRA